jgi:hypothetical protein
LSAAKLLHVGAPIAIGRRATLGTMECCRVETKGMKSDSIARIRGAAKVAMVAMTTNEVMAIAFEEIARRIDPDVSPGTLQLFRFISAVLVGFWFQSDARRAYLLARENGYIVARDTPERSVAILENCPKRWLVKLYLDLNPWLARR